MNESSSENLGSYAVAELYADGGDTVGVASAGGDAGQRAFPKLKRGVTESDYLPRFSTARLIGWVRECCDDAE